MGICYFFLCKLPGGKLLPALRRGKKKKIKTKKNSNVIQSNTAVNVLHQEPITYLFLNVSDNSGPLKYRKFNIDFGEFKHR